MNAKQFLVLVCLAAIWGGSFLLMRIAAPEFGALALIGVRVTVAALVLWPVIYWRGTAKELPGNTRLFVVLGLTNAAIPFSLFAFATISLAAGFTSVLNSLAPMFTAIIGFLWLRNSLSFSAVLGIAIGVAGVIFLSGDTANLTGRAQWLGVVAGVSATVLYGFAANYAKEYKSNLSPLAVAAGHLMAAAIIMLPFTLYFWPATPPSGQAWLAAIVLAVLCTGLAHLMYFWLLQEVSAHGAVSVTFMVPMFGMFWGYLVLGEPLTLHMVAGCAAILLGVALTTGLVALQKKATS